MPSNWETEGFGVYNYGRGKQPESNETGTYRYKFTVPASWKGKSVHIVFEGVMTDTKVSPLLPPIKQSQKKTMATFLPLLLEWKLALGWQAV